MRDFSYSERRVTDAIFSFDVDPPIDCDDEYWENPDPALAFKQPEGKPSKMSFFLSLLKLTEIHYATQRAFVSFPQPLFLHPALTYRIFQYSVRRPEVPAGMTPAEWDRVTLSNLDSSLNAWVDSVPDHCKLLLNSFALCSNLLAL